MRVPEPFPALAVWQVLLHGESFTGKTALMAHTAVNSEFPFVRKISGDELIGMSEVRGKLLVALRCARFVLGVTDVISSASSSPPTLSWDRSILHRIPEEISAFSPGSSENFSIFFPAFFFARHGRHGLTGALKYRLRI